LLFDFVSWNQAYIVTAYDPGNSGKEGGQVNHHEIQSLDLGVEYNTLKWLNLDTTLSAKLHVTPDSEAPSKFGEPKKSDFFGFDLEAYGYYSWKPNLGIGTSLFYQRMAVNNSDYEFIRNSYGVGFDFVYDI